MHSHVHIEPDIMIITQGGSANQVHYVHNKGLDLPIGKSSKYGSYYAGSNGVEAFISL